MILSSDMSDLIKNLELALDEMAKTGNEIGIRILERAINQAREVIKAKSSGTSGGNPA